MLTAIVCTSNTKGLIEVTPLCAIQKSCVNISCPMDFIVVHFYRSCAYINQEGRECMDSTVCHSDGFVCPQASSSESTSILLCRETQDIEHKDDTWSFSSVLLNDCTGKLCT